MFYGLYMVFLVQKRIVCVEETVSGACLCTGDISGRKQNGNKSEGWNAFLLDYIISPQR